LLENIELNGFVFAFSLLATVAFEVLRAALRTLLDDVSPRRPMASVGRPAFTEMPGFC